MSSLIGYAQPKAGLRANGKLMTTGETITICAGSSITYLNQASNGSSVNWRFNNGTPKVSSQPSPATPILYTTGGTDTTWQIVSEGNLHDTTFILVKVTTVKPIPAFSSAPAGECANIPVQFTNTSSGGSTLSYSWNFGVGQGKSTATNPSYSFQTNPAGAALQDFTVTLTVTNEGFCTDSIKKVIQVKKTPDPSINRGDPAIEYLPDFNGVPTFRKCENTPSFVFTFINSSTTIATNTEYTIQWGDGSPDSLFTAWSAGTSIKHLYQRGNTLTTVRVKGPDGCIGIRTYNIFVGTTPAGGFASKGNTSICAPNGLSFVISEFSNNAPGTLYRVTVNDGTTPTTFSHPPPNEVLHIFDFTSCGTQSSNGSQNFSNSYSAELSVQNPCGTTSVNVIPIYVSGKPKAKFVVSPSRNVCTNSNISFFDANIYGGAITPTGGSNSICDNNGKKVWSISPATGYTIVNGILGSVNGRPESGFFWTNNGSGSLNVRFTQAGVYTVKIYAANDLCGVDSFSQTICVRNPPTASFTMDKKNGCAPSVVNITNTTPAGTCGGDSFLWNVQFSDIQKCGTTNGATFTNGTTNTSEHPQITFSTPGRYIVELTVNSIANNCTSAIFRDTFYATSKPKVDLANLNGICEGNALTPTATVSNCYGLSPAVYAWTFAGGTPNSANIANPGPVNFASNGSFNISLGVTNECGTTNAVKPITVGSKPTANAGADKEICSNQPISIGMTPISGVTYTWTPANSLNNANIANPTVQFLFNGPSADTTLQFVLRAATGVDCFSTDTVLVKVKRGPVVVVSPASSVICTGDSVNLTASGADTYSWSPSNGLNVSNQAVVIAKPNATNLYTVTGTLANGCQSTGTALISVVFFTPANAGPDKNYCSGANTTIGTAPSGMNYSWKPITGLSNASIANPTVNFIYNGPNADTVLQYILTASAGASCSSTDTVLVTVRKSPAVMVNPASATICTGGNVTLTASGADSFTWTPITGLNATNVPVVIAAPTLSTLYSIKGALANGCEQTATVKVDVINRPKPDAGTDTTTCNNTNAIQLNGQPTGGIWSGSTQVTSTGIFNPASAGNGTYKLYYSFQSNGCDGIDSLLITVIDPPFVNAGNDTSFCTSTGFAQLGGQPAGGRWSGAAIVSADGRVSLNTPGVFVLTYSVGSGSCISSDNITLTVGNGILNNTLGNNVGICEGATPPLLTGSVATAGSYTVSYQWQESIDSLAWTNINGETAKDYQPPALNTTRFFRRVASTSLCPGASPSLPVKVFIHPNARALFTPTVTASCAPFVLNPAIVGISTFADQNSEYRWFVNGNSIGTGTTFPDYTIAVAGTNIVVRLVTISLFGCVNDTLEQTFSTIPTPQPAWTQSDSVGCGPLTITFNNQTPNANLFTYDWDFGNGQTSKAQQPGPMLFPIHPDFGDTVYTVRFTVMSACDTFKLTRFVRVRAKPKASFTPDKAIGCSPMTVNFTNNSRGSNASFIWSWDDGTPNLSSNDTLVTHTLLTNRLDTFFVRLVGTNDCGRDTLRFGIVVNPNAIKLNVGVSGDQLNGCAPLAVRFVNNTVGANLFRWDFGDGTTLVTTRGLDTVPHTYTSTGTFDVTVFSTNGCSDSSTTFKIQVNKMPQVSFSAQPLTFCLGEKVTFTNTSEDGLAWNWMFGDGTVSTEKNPQKLYTTAGNYRIVLRGTRIFPEGFGCTDSAIANVIVNSPSGRFTYRSGFVCANTPVVFTATSSNTSVYRFYFGNGDSLISSIPQVTYIYPTAGAYLPYLILESGDCKLRIQGVDSIRAERLVTGFTRSAIQVCASTTLQFQDTSFAFFGIRSWNWNFGDNTRSTLQSPSKTFTREGNYNVNLTIVGNSGCVGQRTIPISVAVEPFPRGSITGDSLACIGQIANFSAVVQSTQPLSNISWDLGNGNFATGNNAIAVYRVAGNVTINMVSRTQFGCADTVYRVIKVRPSPIVNAGPDARICRGQTTILRATGAANYRWSPSQGLSCTGCVSPVASPTSTTNYVVAATNVEGCTSTDTVVVNVEQRFKISTTGTDSICVGGFKQLTASGANNYRWLPTTGLSATNIPNPVARPGNSTTYQVVGYDAFNCFTDTAYVRVGVGAFPTVDLGTGTLLVAGTSVVLQPSITNGPIKNYIWTPITNLSCTNCANPTATINTNSSIKLTVETFYGCTSSDTISFKVQCQPDQVYIPNAFSPDKDGKNDVFMVRGKGTSKVRSFRVFNRYGQLVFDKANFNANDASAGWDGKVTGKPAAPDVYVYTVEVICTAGAVYTYQGNVTLFR